MSLSALTSFSFKPSHIVSPNHPHPHPHSLTNPPSLSLSSRGGWYLPRRSTKVRSEREVRGLGRDIDGWNHRRSNHSPLVQAFTHAQSFSTGQSKVCHQPQSNDQAPRPLQIHREPPLTRYRSTIDVVWDFFFSYFCEQNLGLGFFFFFFSQICWVFLVFCCWDFQIF